MRTVIANRRDLLLVGMIFALCLSAQSGIAGSAIYVDDSADGLADGTTWCDGYLTLQDALEATANSAGTITEIRIAQGLYVPDRGTGQTPGLRTSTFQLINGVTLLGGFAGCGTVAPDDRDISLYRTILSGDLAGDDVGNRFDPSHYENAYHVVTASGTDDTTTLDGVSIISGRADGAPPFDSGAGMYNVGGSPNIVDCSLYENWALLNGGAIHNSDNANPHILRCHIYDNAGDYGGAIYNDNHCSPTIEDCFLTRNFVGYYGGGIYNGNQSHATIVDCTFLDNEAFYQGGGVANFGGSNPMIQDCLFDRNRARNSVGGGMYNQESNPTLMGLVFHENHAGVSGGAMYNSVSGPTLSDCEFKGNDARNGGAILNLQSSCAMHDCLFERNRAVMNGGAIYNLGATGVSLINTTLTRNEAVQNAGGLYNDRSDPVVRNSILWGNTDVTGVTLSSQMQGGSPTVDYSCVQGLDPSSGTGNLNDDPLLIPGPSGCSYLSQLTAGDSAESPCVDASEDTSADVGLQDRTTRIDEIPDDGFADLGYHYPISGSTCVLNRYQCEQKSDLRQVALFATCFTHAGAPSDPCCSHWDLDANGDINLSDFETMQAALDGP